MLVLYEISHTFLYQNKETLIMIKNLLIAIALLLFAGCSEKAQVVKAKPYYKPIVPKQSQQAPVQATNPDAPMPVDKAEETTLGEPIELEIGGETLNKSNSKSYVTTFKTKQFSFSDAGFMRQEDGVIDLQILALGKPLLKMTISEDVCVDHFCRTKQEFNENYLSPDYPHDLINNVLTSQPIFGGENLRKTSNGFLQRIQSPLYDIKYKITPGSIYFKDLKNGIIIKLRELY